MFEVILITVFVLALWTYMWTNLVVSIARIRYKPVPQTDKKGH